MDNIELAGQESDDQLIEDINQIKGTALGEGVAVCAVCDEVLREGDGVVVFAFRPAGQPAFRVGHVKCCECRHEPTEFLTLGVREVVVDGRVGTCTDRVTQSSWPVLLSPRPRVVSPAGVTTVQPLPGVAWFRLPVARSEVFAAVDCASSRKPWQRAVVRINDSDVERTPESDVELGDAVDGAAVRAPGGDGHGGVR